MTLHLNFKTLLQESLRVRNVIKKDAENFHGLRSFRSKNSACSRVYTECLILSYWSGYLNFCVCFIKNILLEQKTTKLRNKWYSVEPLTGLPHLFRFQDHTQLDTPQSVGLFWMRDWPVTKTSTWQHTTFTRDRQLCPQTDWKPQTQQESSHRPTSCMVQPLGLAAT